MAYIEFGYMVKGYPSGNSMIRALDEASFTAEQDKLNVILGQSGAGRTTALNILGSMDTAITGRVVVGGHDITNLREKGLVTYRRNNIGFVFQFYNLMPNLTVLENVELASQIHPDRFDPAETLYKVGLGERMGNFPARLSGGKQQRVSIARAIAKKPKLLLCDEPTGAFNYETGKGVLRLLQSICRAQGMTVVVITHDSALALMVHKMIRFCSGKVISEEVNTTPQPITNIEWQVIDDVRCKTLCETFRETSETIRETVCEMAEPRR